MKVFVTGGTGFIGTYLVKKLSKEGYEVSALTRSDDGAQKLTSYGVTPIHGRLEDTSVLTAAAKEADAIVHLAFDHSKLGTANFAEACDLDADVINALADGIEGTDKPLLITSGTAFGNHDGQPATEDYFETIPKFPRGRSEVLARELSTKGINTKIVRLPQVHDTKTWGLLTFVLPLFQKAGRALYLGDGSYGASAAHVDDVVDGYVKIIHDKSEPGSAFHLVGEESVSQKDWSSALAKKHGLEVKSATPEEVSQALGPLEFFLLADLSAKSDITRKALNWEPKGPSLVEDVLASA